MPNSKATSWRNGVIAIGLFLIALNAPQLIDWARGEVAYDAARAGPVTVFSTQWCGYCKKTKHFLKTHDIPFNERDIEASDAARDAFDRLGGNGVPLVLVGDRVVRGYSLGSLREALECRECAQSAAAP